MPNKPVCVFTSDWHIRHDPPRCRTDEPDWLAALERPIRHMLSFDIPIIVAGDVFHRYDGDAKAAKLLRMFHWWDELTHGAIIRWIPGQHDLRDHRLEEYQHAAAKYLPGNLWHGNARTEIFFVNISGFPDVTMVPYGEEPPVDGIGVGILVGHRYVCMDRPPPGMDALTAMDALKTYPGYSHLVFGDNHHGFHVERGGRHVICPGSITRNDMTQKDYHPRCYLLMSDGSVREEPLPIDQDIFTDVLTAEVGKHVGMESFMKTLRATENVVENYSEVAMDLVNNSGDELAIETVATILKNQGKDVA